MSDVVISAQSLGKRYSLRRKAGGSGLLRDRLVDLARGLVKRTPSDRDREDFWALRDISFDIKRGDVVGIIGRNGAGKSTLLKILSRITEPTTGRVTIHGRVASLLEVGTGFHGELSGRENIFLNGAILGMTRAEIRRKFDEIVAFAEVEKFLDTPVKHYSSGMYVRLAFAVAAHLEPEILIVDEVLAVGDAAFQKKCLAKINQVATCDGRTVLLVSHNTDVVLSLCSAALLLSGGQLELHGSTSDAVKRYCRRSDQCTRELRVDHLVRPAWARRGIQVECVRYLGMGDPWSIDFGSTLSFSAAFRVEQNRNDWRVYVAIFSLTGVEVAATQSPVLAPVTSGQHGELEITFPNLRLTPGSYLLTLGVRAGEQMEDYLSELITVEIRSSMISASQQTFAFRGAYVPDAKFGVSDGGAPA